MRVPIQVNACPNGARQFAWASPFNKYKYIYIYINDIRSIGNDNNAGISIYNNDADAILRSDSLDITVAKLNKAIRFFEPWFQKWRLKINADTCTSYFIFQNSVRLLPKYPSTDR
jgi:hypothetical protein